MWAQHLRRHVRTLLPWFWAEKMARSHNFSQFHLRTYDFFLYCLPLVPNMEWKSISWTLISISACNCFGRSEECVYDEDLDKNGLSLDIHGNFEGGGRCLNCRVWTLLYLFWLEIRKYQKISRTTRKELTATSASSVSTNPKGSSGVTRIHAEDVCAIRISIQVHKLVFVFSVMELQRMCILSIFLKNRYRVLYNFFQ